MTGQSSIFCWKPIFLFGSFFFSSRREESSAMARYRLSISCRTSSERSLTAPRFSSCWSCSRSTLTLSSFNSAETVALARRYCLTWTKARMIEMFTAMEISLFRTPESMATLCSIKAKGGADTFLFDAVTNCDRLFRTSSAVNWNMKSGGNLLMFLFTAWFNTFVSTWYSFARSESSITFCPRIS